MSKPIKKRSPRPVPVIFLSHDSTIRVREPQTLQYPCFPCFHNACVLVRLVVETLKVQYTVNEQMRPMGVFRALGLYSLRPDKRRADDDIAQEPCLADLRVPIGEGQHVCGPRTPPETPVQCRGLCLCHDSKTKLHAPVHIRQCRLAPAHQSRSRRDAAAFASQAEIKMQALHAYTDRSYVS